MKKLIIPAAVFAAMLLFTQCSSSKKSATTSTYTGPVTVTYQANVLPIVQAHCAPCHISGKGNKASLDKYDVAQNNINDIIRRISLEPGKFGFMPKKHDRLSDDLIQVFKDWKTQGMVDSK